MSRRAWDIVLPLGLLVALALVPKVGADIPKLFNGPINSPGTLQLLALCLVFAGLALTYDLLFGFTGLLSFGHAFYFAVGVYMTAIALTKWHWSFAESLLFVAVVGLVLPVVIGAVSLRVGGIAFAMVTLAVAQVGAVLAIKNPHGWTGGEEGFGTDYTKLPEAFVGVLNTKHLYWLALGYAAAVFVIVRWAVESSPGRIWQAIRENEQRVEVLGLHPHPFKLTAFVLSSFLATAGGVVYLLLGTGPNPEVTSANLTLTLLIMVVLGGAGTKWGAMIGGVLYTYLNNRLGAIGDSSTVQGLPDVLRVPLSQPLFLLGTLFILIVFFAPGGITGLAARGRRPAAMQRLEGALRTERAEATAPVQTTEEGA
jgi:branched-chain amino acid transport system permease protein